MSLTVPVAEIVESSGSSLLGIHESWARVRLGDIAHVLNGFAFPSASFSDGSGVPLIRIRDVMGAQTECHYVGSYDDSYLVRPGELLIGMDGDFNCALWRGPVGLLNQRVCKVTVDSRYYDLSFLVYALPGYLRAINEVTSSVTVKHLSSRSVEDIPLPLPPLAEQCRIVAAIEQQFTRLDAGVANLRRVQAALKRYRAAVLKAAVEGKLTEAWRAEHPDVEPAPKLLERILAERRARWEADVRVRGKDPAKVRYEEPSDFATTGLPVLPYSWCWVTLDGLLCGIQAGKNFKCDEHPPADDEVGVVKVSAVTWGEYNEQESKTCTDGTRIDSALFVREGDFLFSRANTIELVGACVIAKHVSKRVMLSDKILRMSFVAGVQDWVLWALRSRLGRDEIECLATGNQESMRNIAQENIRRIRIPVPPADELKQLVADIERRMSIVSELEDAVRANLKRAERLRQSILERAFSGQLVPQDPNDEPASTLLERIRNEREAHVKNGRTPPASRRTGSENGHRTTAESLLVDILATPTSEPVSQPATARQASLWQRDPGDQ